MTWVWNERTSEQEEDNKEKYDKFLCVVNKEKFGSADSAILFDDWKNIDKLFEENNMKFDVCIMNPPYDKNLHLQILSKVIEPCYKIGKRHDRT